MGSLNFSKAFIEALICDPDFQIPGCAVVYTAVFSFRRLWSPKIFYFPEIL